MEFQGAALGPQMTWADLRGKVKGAARPWTFRFVTIVPDEAEEPEPDEDEGL